VVAGLKAGLEGRSFGNGARVSFRDVDFSTLSFKEQIAVDVTTDVMIGPHGAGLMHNVFMPDRAGLIELFVDGSSANRHFHNLATWAVGASASARRSRVQEGGRRLGKGATESERKCKRGRQ